MINTVILVGRVGQQPKITYYESGKIQTVFSLAVNRPKKSHDLDDITDWFKIEVWGKFAEVANEYLRKGVLVGIEGRLEFKKWKDQKGQSKESFIIVASNFRLLGSKHDIEVPPPEKF
ncbi:MAG: single-stranded DNA-binding protein [Candidatus Sericytochromatia bacterium]